MMTPFTAKAFLSILPLLILTTAPGIQAETPSEWCSPSTTQTDILFLIDTSASMCGYIETITDKFAGLVASLRGKGVSDLRFAVAAFGGVPRLVQKFSDSVQTTTDTLSNIECTSPGWEAGLEALRVSLAPNKGADFMKDCPIDDMLAGDCQLVWRNGTKVIVMATDEDSDYPTLSSYRIPNQTPGLCARSYNDTEGKNCPSKQTWEPPFTPRTFWTPSSQYYRETVDPIQLDPTYTEEIGLTSTTLLANNVILNMLLFVGSQDGKGLPISSFDKTSRYWNATHPNPSPVSDVDVLGSSVTVMQYGHPALQSHNANFTGFDAMGTLEKLESEGVGSSLQGLVLANGGLMRVYEIQDLLGGDAGNVVDSMLGTAVDVKGFCPEPAVSNAAGATATAAIETETTSTSTDAEDVSTTSTQYSYSFTAIASPTALPAPTNCAHALQYWTTNTTDPAWTIYGGTSKSFLSQPYTLLDVLTNRQDYSGPYFDLAREYISMSLNEANRAELSPTSGELWSVAYILLRDNRLDPGSLTWSTTVTDDGGTYTARELWDALVKYNTGTSGVQFDAVACDDPVSANLAPATDTVTSSTSDGVNATPTSTTLESVAPSTVDSSPTSEGTAEAATSDLSDTSSTSEIPTITITSTIPTILSNTTVPIETDTDTDLATTMSIDSAQVIETKSRYIRSATISDTPATSPSPTDDIVIPTFSDASDADSDSDSSPEPSVANAACPICRNSSDCHASTTCRTNTIGDMCGCDVGFKASGDGWDTVVQWRVGSADGRVYVRPGVECVMACDDVGCGEVVVSRCDA